MVQQTLLRVSEDEFSSLLRPKVDDEQYRRAHTLFCNYQRQLSFDITNVLLAAFRAGEFEDALQQLERYFREDLVYQDPEIRGMIVDNLLGVNPTQSLLVRMILRYREMSSN